MIIKKDNLTNRNQSQNSITLLDRSLTNRKIEGWFLGNAHCHCLSIEMATSCYTKQDFFSFACLLIKFNKSIFV